MNITQEAILQKQYWSTSEVADILEVEESCVRYWCDEFKIKLHRSQSNHRKFTMSNITTLQVIKCLLYKEMFTVEGAHIKLKLFKWPISASRVEEEIKRQLVRILQQAN